MAPITKLHERRVTELGFAHFESGCWQQAEVTFREAAMLDPDDEDAWIGLGSALRQQGRNEEAAIVFGTAAVVARSSGAWATLLAADALLEAGAGEEAREALNWFDVLASQLAVTEPQRQLATALRDRTEKQP